MSVNTTDTLYVDGAWREASGGGSIPVTNPATEEPIADVRSASEADVEAALDAAASAQKEWELTPARERGDVLRDVSALMLEHTDELAELITREQGKPIEHARGEIEDAADLVQYMAEWDRRIEGDVLPGDTRRESVHLLRKPHGVVSAIIPWNYPVAVFVRKLAPALVTGNTLVGKPSEQTPLATIRLVELIHEEGDVPDGVLNLVTGAGDVGRALVTADQVSMVTMTGHVETGKAIMRDAADDLTTVSLELGGKAPAIVWKDADLDAAIDKVLAARVANAGQVCTCAERVYVYSDVAEEFVEKYATAARDLELSDPLGDADMGPLVSAEQVEKSAAAVENARKQGAEVEVGGRAPDRPGHWYEPTLVTNAEQGMDIMQEEVFGPVLPVTTVDSFEEALEYANDSRYGLSSYVYTDDYQLAMRFAEELEFGETYINRSIGELWQGHHIGWNESGTGGEDGKYGLQKYTQLKTVYHNYE
ncbi:aldehyde dehydrogenase [Halococcus agarilyticus]|uniref:aldehyde dehydrogenase n=1 Tax=Halococcus agarilyticus TaxID=1232219 RepID=UPI00067827EB|nr:aldehyde dehydrogenase [Halococcus agarilyticus]